MRSEKTGRLLATKTHGLICKCEQCGLEFKPKNGSTGRFCTKKCDYQNKRDQKLHGRHSYFNCCKCHAALGFGIVKSAQFVGKEKGSIAKGIRAAKIQRYQPEGGSWHVYATRNKKLVLPWWGDEESEKGWMSEYDFKFPDWQRMAGIKKLDICIAKYLKDEVFVAEYQAAAKKRNRENTIKSNKKRKIIDPGFKVQCNLRNRLKDLMKTTKKGGAHHVSALIGCSTKQLAKHLESQFKKGMTWDNYGWDGWHVDHILPCSSFDHNDERQVAQCWHWTNLRPLWAKDNIEKSDHITEPQMQLLFGSIH